MVLPDEAATCFLVTQRNPRHPLITAEVGGSTVRGIDRIDNTLRDGFTLNTGKGSFNGNDRGFINDSGAKALSP